MKDTDQELLDEMIIKDVPESESSTDPVKAFEETHPPASIESIQEDQEDASDSECKDQYLSNLALATNPPHSSHPLPSPSSSDRSLDMKHKDEDKFPGLAAPDSKDSLEVQLTSACEDLSESQISGKGSLDETQQRQESSDSEEERQPTVNERSASEDAGKRTSISDFVFEEEKATERKIQLVDTDVTTETSDDDFEFLSRKEVDEAQIVVKNDIRKEDITADDDKYTPQPAGLLEPMKTTDKLESIPSTDTEPRQSRPSSSDYSDIYRQKEEEEEADSSDEERNTEIIKTNEPRIPSASSDYSDIEEKKAVLPVVVDSSDYERDAPANVRKSSASSAISDVDHLKPRQVVDSSSEYDHEVIKDEYVRDPHMQDLRPESASSGVSDNVDQKTEVSAKKDDGSSSESEEDGDIAKPTQARKSSVSSAFSDVADKKKPEKADSSESEEDGEMVKLADPRKSSVSSAYSDVEKKPETRMAVVDSSDFETEVAKPIERKSSASSAYSETVENKTKPAVHVDSDSSESEEENEIVKPADPRLASASSDYSDVEKKPEIKTEAIASSDFETKLVKPIERKSSESSAYSDKEGQKDQHAAPADSDSSESEEDDEIANPTDPRIPSASSDYSDVEKKPVGMRKESAPARPQSSDFSDIDVRKEDVSRKQSAPARAYSSAVVDSSDFETNISIPIERKSSASSAYSDKEDKKNKPQAPADSDSSESEEDGKIVKPSDPRIPSASSDYSDVEKRPEIKVVVSDSDYEKEVEKPVERKSSASSAYSDVVERKTQNVVDSSSDQEPGKISTIAQVIPHDSISSEFSEKEEEKPDVKERVEEIDFEKEAEFVSSVPARPISSDYSDIDVSKPVVMRKESAPARPESSDYSDIDVRKEDLLRKQSAPARPSSSDYSDLDVRKPSAPAPPRPISSDYSDIDVSKPVVMRKESAPARAESSDYSDIEVKKEDVIRKQSAPARASSSDYSDVDAQKGEVAMKRESSLSSEFSDVETKKMAAVAESVHESDKIEPGIIQIVVHKAGDLVNQEIMGKSDPYVLIKFRGQEFRSETIKNTINPEWNFSADLIISEVYDSNINIEVFDDDSGLDSCEGILVLSLVDAIKKSDEEGRWYSLTNCKHGRIFVSCVYTAMPMPTKAARTRTYSSSSEEEVTKDQNTVLQHSSSDSSTSGPREKTKVKHQMAMDRASLDDESVVLKRGPFKPQSSSEYSDTDNERKGAKGGESSSDYDTTPRGKRKNRPESVVSDTSSDCGSSNVGTRPRPLSQFLDDEYDIITEEEAAETKSEKKEEADQSSSSESDGPEVEDAPAPANIIDRLDVEQDGASLLPPSLTPHPPTLSSSVASNSDQHAWAEQISHNVEIANNSSSVINSNTLDEIGPLADDPEHSSLLTKQTETRKSSGVAVTTSRASSSTSSSIDQAKNDGSVESEQSQGIQLNENEFTINLFSILFSKRE